jgi:peptide/nickel transport system permease protein
MLDYVIRRILLLIPTIVIVAIIAFSVTHLMPGDPVRLMLGNFASEERVAVVKKELGFDKPLPTQFVIWVKNVAQGNLGTSIFLFESVSSAIASRFEPTLLLAIIGQFLGIIIGVPLGVLAATKHRTVVDQASIGISLIGLSIPSFVFALGLMLLFALELRWFPVAGYRPISEIGWGVVKYLTLPGLSLGIGQSAIIARMTRSAMLDVISQDYILTARSKGLSEQVVIFKHALRNALIPVVSVVGLSMAFLLGGTWIIEVIFAIPGTGQLALTSISRRDYFVIQGCLVWVAIIYLLVNIIVDVSYAFINPRIRFK